MSTDSKKEKKEETAPAKGQSQKPENEAPERSLFGMLKYKTEDDFDHFVSNLSKQEAVITLIANARYAIAKGGLSPEEAEVLSKAMRVLQRKDGVAKPADVEKSETKEEPGK